MATGVVYTNTRDDVAVQGALFQGIKFWLSQRVPMRSQFINDVKSNGGEVVISEKQADVKIVDHARKEAIPGTYSYRFIESSIRNGTLETLADHAVGPLEGTPRNVGSIVQPPKTTRRKYTQEDERILWEWVNTNPQKRGGTDGNEIYKQLESKYPQHTWQSWRDHWIKQLKGRPRPVYPPNNAPLTPPLDPQNSTNSRLEAEAPTNADSGADDDNFDSFDEEDALDLLAIGDLFLDADPQRNAATWQKWAEFRKREYKPHSLERWQALWKINILPRYLRRKAKRERKETLEDGQASQSTMANIYDEFSNRINPPTDDPDSNAAQAETSNATRRPLSTLGKLSNSKDAEAYYISEAATDDEQQNIVSPIGSSILKRKRKVFEDDLSTNNPIVSPTPAPRRNFTTPASNKEIASTPDPSPSRRRTIRAPSPPLFITEEEVPEDEEQIYEYDEEELGQEPSESLSQPDRHFNPQSTNENESDHFIDLNVPSPDGGWSLNEEEGSPEIDEDSQSVYESAASQPPEERSHHADTQAIFAEKTQTQDFLVAEPEGGWGDLHHSSSPAVPDSPDEESAADKTQTQDFFVAEPDGGWDNVLRLSSPAIPESLNEESAATTAANTENINESPPADVNDSLDARLDAWISARSADGFFTDDEIENVLNRACMDTELAGCVLQSMKEDGDAEKVLPENVTGLWTEIDDEDLHGTDARKISRLERKHGADCLQARWEFLDFMAGGDE